MNTQAKLKTEASVPVLVKADPTSPVIKITGRDIVSIKAGTSFGPHTFESETGIPFPEGHPKIGCDYVVVDDFGKLCIVEATGSSPNGDFVLGGFHFAPGGNASARSGGDETPAINPFSVWDRNFRPACDDPRGMALVEKPGGKFWADIYLLNVGHHEYCTSRFGEKIADGNDCPINPDTKKPFKRFDYETAIAVMKHHGKQLPSLEEFFALAFGVTEKTSSEDDPDKTKLDAKRTSKFGIMQATGNLWVWGHDGDPDEPRASFFGGSWWDDDNAGSRYARVGHWADNSTGNLSARGRSDHLQPV